MPRVMANVASSDWAIHFIAPDGQTRIGPWLLMDSHEAVLEILRWGNLPKEELEEHEASIRRWGCSSVHLELTDAQYVALIERGRGWPGNGYELRKMKEAGKYPPKPLTSKARRDRQLHALIACPPGDTMCGRYYRVEDKQAIAEYFRSAPANDELLPPGFNIAPTTRQAVIRQGRDTSARELVGMRWGLVGFGSKGPDPKRATFNARSENLATSGLWRTPLHKRRCLVPLSGFYEWRKSDKVAFRFTLSDQPIYALAGLWDAWKNPDTGEWLQSFSAITVEASPAMQGIHDRMPAILSPRDYDEWLDRGEVERPPVHLLRPYDASPAGPYLEVKPAHPKVGNVRNQDISMLDSQ